MTAAQRLASDPDFSVWTSASAGSGKTKALSDRVLRLLLRGESPRGVLCLTYTQAAAHEMNARVRAALASYALADDATLAAALAALGDAQVASRSLASVRRLAMEILESDESVRIGTIHSVCRSLISRFPREAGYEPSVRFLETREAAAMRDAAKARVFGKESEKAALADFCRHLGTEDSLDLMLDAMLKSWDAMKRAELHTEGGMRDAEIALRRFLGLSDNDVYHPSLAAECYPSDDSALKKACAALRQCAGATEKKAADAMEAFIAAPGSDGAAENYAQIFLTKDGEPRKKIVTAKSAKFFPALEAFMRGEQERMQETATRRDAFGVWERSASLWRVAGAILREYEHIKRRDGAVDFDDMIASAARLLKESDAALNALYAMDRRIRHILVDEAQDTSPTQWDVIEALSAEFFSGDAKEGRSLFVVGDEKQSIFRFQGAHPENFIRMRGFFSGRALEANKPFKTADMDVSFRTVPEILRTVDAVFAEEGAMRHESARARASGRVVLWPLCRSEEEEKGDAWHIPGEADPKKDGKAAQAEEVADFIARALENGYATASRPDGIHPNDFMILVRQRFPMASLIRSALMRRGVPVAPPDKFMVREHLVAQDMLAMATVACYPHDDFAMAPLLLSPFFGMDGKVLEELCLARDGSLYEEMRKRPKCAPYVDKIRRYAALAHGCSPKDFFERLIYEGDARRVYRERWGDEADVVIDRLLAEADEAARGKTCAGLRPFLSSIKRSKIALSGDSSHSDAVRILTVHGAKGLQAPIAIIVDAAASRSVSPPFFWMEAGDAGGALPVWPGVSKNASVRALKEREKALDAREKSRLLYVAMTRAADELHVFGAGNKEASPESWYARIARGAEALGGTRDAEWALIYGRQMPRVPPLPSFDLHRRKESGVPEFLSRPVPEKRVSRVASPSEAVTAHYRTAGGAAERGERVHRLIERLSAMLRVFPLGQEEDAIRAVCVGEKDPGAAETLLRALVAAPEIAALLREDARFEVPLIGAIDGKPVSGRADILTERADSVAVVDVKTGARPADAAFVAYRRQLATYAILTAAHYAEKPVRAFILWADEARLEEI
ncbi:MAG: UvrD-helicase domain-containing protein [Rickettsiales bacterium]